MEPARPCPPIIGLRMHRSLDDRLAALDETAYARFKTATARAEFAMPALLAKATRESGLDMVAEFNEFRLKIAFCRRSESFFIVDFTDYSDDFPPDTPPTGGLPLGILGWRPTGDRPKEGMWFKSQLFKHNNPRNSLRYAVYASAISHFIDDDFGLLRSISSISHFMTSLLLRIVFGAYASKDQHHASDDVYHPPRFDETPSEARFYHSLDLFESYRVDPVDRPDSPMEEARSFLPNPRLSPLVLIAKTVVDPLTLLRSPRTQQRPARFTLGLGT